MENQLIADSAPAPMPTEYIICAYGLTLVFLIWMGVHSMRMLKRSQMKLNNAESQRKSL